MVQVCMKLFCLCESAGDQRFCCSLEKSVKNIWTNFYCCLSTGYSIYKKKMQFEKDATTETYLEPSQISMMELFSEQH